MPVDFAHPPLSRVAPYRVPAPLACYESNTTFAVVIVDSILIDIGEDECYVSVRYALSLGEQLRYLRACFYSGQRHPELESDADALAALGATASDHCTTALGGHACTEAMAFRPLPLVRLVGALHVRSL